MTCNGTLGSCWLISLLMILVENDQLSAHVLRKKSCGAGTSYFYTVLKKMSHTWSPLGQPSLRSVVEQCCNLLKLFKRGTRADPDEQPDVAQEEHFDESKRLHKMLHKMLHKKHKLKLKTFSLGAPRTAVYKFVRCNPEGDQANCVTQQSPKMAWSPELPAKLPASTARYL